MASYPQTRPATDHIAILEDSSLLDVLKRLAQVQMSSIVEDLYLGEALEYIE